MSHKATTWLSTIPASSINSSEFRVLFHLCDCHNPSAGCFPTQAYLIDHCGVSNGTLNNALNSLEQKKLIRRHRERDGETKRQKPTRYVLGFEFQKDVPLPPETGDGSDGGRSPKTGGGAPRKPSPKAGGGRKRKPSPRTGAGKKAAPSPKSGGGADSNRGGDPSPTKGVTRLQPAGEVTCKEPVNNHRGGSGGRFFSDDERFEAKEISGFIKDGGEVNAAAISARVRDCILSEKMITAEQAAAQGLC